LSSPPLDRLDAGIVLQAYLPDSHAALDELCAWARTRHRRAGGTIKVRVVKGANLAMERVESELEGWPQAPFRTKAEVDASYKRLLDVALRPKMPAQVRVGVASHNLFDVGWALARREQLDDPRRIEIEMLEGMANPQALATAQMAGGLLLYAPVVHRDDFASAVAYLVRRPRREHRAGELPAPPVRPRARQRAMGNRTAAIPRRGARSSSPRHQLPRGSLGARSHHRCRAVCE
jgi:RHH-type proline utilization regulon transcriptional repressor/proline dehydrogenase/delta 1-pyrroline-5-carboxylate dehydrogenase